MSDRLRTSSAAAFMTLVAAAFLLAPGLSSCSTGGSTEPSPDAEAAEGRMAEADSTSNGSAPDLPEAEPEPAEAIAQPPAAPQPGAEEPMTEPTTPETPTREIATLGAGCFWCIEAVLEQVDGVEAVVSGYMGGENPNPTYREVCTGRTGHAEVVQVTFDPTVITYAELLDWFWRLHDPTTLNRQGADVGTQYRSAIFTHSDEQARIAGVSKRDVQPSFSDPIVTEITPASEFYEAEDYHQGYYGLNSSAGYCRAVIAPKLKKLGLKY